MFEFELWTTIDDYCSIVSKWTVSSSLKRCGPSNPTLQTPRNVPTASARRQPCQGGSIRFNKKHKQDNACQMFYKTNKYYTYSEYYNHHKIDLYLCFWVSKFNVFGRKLKLNISPSKWCMNHSKQLRSWNFTIKLNGYTNDIFKFISKLWYLQELTVTFDQMNWIWCFWYDIKDEIHVIQIMQET